MKFVQTGICAGKNASPGDLIVIGVLPGGSISIQGEAFCIMIRSAQCLFPP